MRGSGVMIIIVVAFIVTSPTVLHGVMAEANSGSDFEHEPSFSWARSISNGSAWAVQQTVDGGYIVGGIGQGSAPDGNFWVLKLNRVGEIVWQKSYGEGAINSMEQTQDGGFIVAGSHFIVTGPYGTGSSGSLVLRLDSSGNVIWQKIYFNAVIFSIEETSDRGYIVAGEFSGLIPANAWIAKLDSAGNILWNKAIGGSRADAILSVRQTSDGGFVGGGLTSSFDGLGRAWILRFDPRGDLLWQNVYSGSGISIARSVLQTLDGGYIVAGMTHLPGNYEGAWLLKLNSTGALSWQKAFSETGHSIFFSVQETSDGGYVAAGEAYVYALVVRVDSSGKLVWQRALGGGVGDSAYSIGGTRDGGFVLTGHTFSFGFGYVWVVKLNQDGNCCTRINAPINTPVVATNSSQISSSFTPRRGLVTWSNAIDAALATHAIVLTQCPPKVNHQVDNDDFQDNGREDSQRSRHD